MKRIESLIVLILFLCLSVESYCQETSGRYQIRGTVLEKKTGQSLKNIPVKLLPYTRVVETDKKGRVQLNVLGGIYILTIDYYPFDKIEIPLIIKADTTINIFLTSPFESQYIEPVEVLSSKPVTDNNSSMEHMDKKWMERLPSMVGEKDLLKTLAMTSGVTSSSEGASDIQVRGGTHGQNLYLLDGVPLYSTQHVFGLISAYNPSAIDQVELYKGAFPTRFGGRLSSVLDVQTVDADLRKWKGDVELGLLSSKAAIHIPIIKDKLGLFVAGRISNYSLLSMILPDLLGETSLNTYFSDLNINLIWKPSKKDQLKLSYFSNQDGWDLTQPDNESMITVLIENSQRSLGLNWTRDISEKLKNELKFFSDASQFELAHSSEIKSDNLYFSESSTTKIASTLLSDRFQWKYNNQLSFDAGGSFTYFRLTPFSKLQTDTATSVLRLSSSDGFTETCLYSEANFLIDKNQHLSGGLRFSGVFNDKSYFIVEPRIRYHGIFRNGTSISASISKMSQSLHRVANAGLGFPLELYLPVSSLLKPQEAWIGTLGGAREFPISEGTFSAKVDIWYKLMSNIIDFKEGYDAQTILLSQKDFMNRTEEFVSQGKGKAYGVDLSVQYSQGRTTLVGNYTLMRATNQFDDLNNGKLFAAPTDIRHSLSLTGSFKLSDDFLMTANWQYQSGRPITIPDYVIEWPDPTFPPGLNSNETGDFQFLTTNRANYRTKAFHKLDISFMKNFRLLNRYQSTFSFGVYNAYNRKNAYLYYIQNADASTGEQPTLRMLSLFPTLPSLSMTIKF